MSHNGSSPAPLADLDEQAKQIQALIERIETFPDPAPRALMQECMESVLSFYGSGLERILQVAKEPEGREAYDALINDSVVRGLLLIHGLHPVSLEMRLRQALDKIRPYMQSHGGNVEVISLENDFALLRLDGHCKTCPSSNVTMELAVKQAIEEACPDLMGFEVQGTTGTPSPEPPPEQEPRLTEWRTVDNTQHLANDAMMRVDALGTPLIVCRAGDQLYAYRNHCPACNMPLHMGELHGGLLTCALGHRFDIRQAGLSPGHSGIHLDPFPLLIEKNGAVKVALVVKPAPPETAKS